MDVDDWIVFGGMGSYTVGCKSKFNGMTAVEKIVVLNKNISPAKIVDTVGKTIDVVQTVCNTTEKGTFEHPTINMK